MSVQSVALASLTATYTDSEGEDEVDEHHLENSIIPQGSAPQNAQVPGQPQAITSPKSGQSASNSPNITSTVEGKSVSVSDGEADSYGVIIPPEPPGQCPIDLQEKINVLLRRMESGGLDMNHVIQKRKDFRNPSIYEKLIQFCQINEFGTNYPPDRFDPLKWGKESYYEELAKTQKAEMDKLEKARKEKTKIEIVSGTAKRTNSNSTTADDEAKKRKSKWDQVPTGASINPTLLLSQPTLTSVTSSASGTRATAISAFGSLSLPKKRL